MPSPRHINPLLRDLALALALCIAASFASWRIGALSLSQVIAWIAGGWLILRHPEETTTMGGALDAQWRACVVFAWALVPSAGMLSLAFRVMVRQITISGLLHNERQMRQIVIRR